MNVTPLVARPTWIGQMDLGVHRFDPLYYDPSLTIAERLYKSNGQLKWKRLQEVTTGIYSFGAYELTSLIKFVEPSPVQQLIIKLFEVFSCHVLRRASNTKSVQKLRQPSNTAGEWTD